MKRAEYRRFLVRDQGQARSRTDLRIAVCSGCDRYGVIYTDNGRCAPGPELLTNHDNKRIAHCQRVVRSRKERAS